MSVAADRLFLRRAVELAARGLYGVADNPRVGCLIVRDGRVIGRGWHRRTGAAHAEANAIADADGDIKNATVYVSLEPCCHTGQQPPCTDALIQGGAARVVAAMRDPDPRVGGKGFAQLRAAGIAVDVQQLPEARQLNAGFVKRKTTARPLVRVKLAASVDGRTALASGESQWITGEAARADVQHWRARSSAVVTGIGTVLADDPRLNVRDQRFAENGAVRQPLLAVADSRARTPPGARLFSGGAKVLIFAAKQAPCRDLPGEIVRQSGREVDLDEMLRHLAMLGCNEVLVEAGATLAGAFFRHRLWDEALIYLAPVMLGAGARPMAQLDFDRLADSLAGRVRSVDRLGVDLRLVLEPKPNAEPAAGDGT